MLKRERGTAPYTADELRAMFAQGDSVASIHARAYRIDRSVTKAQVRAILFQEAAHG
ncbi:MULTISPECIES: hypothetical protein [unclassified Sphingobium]|uniref:hypothetical protein n=1 Tax=unclassified Sphingobium TaxID=2611147 RepID=UPI00191910BD|nr:MULTISPECIES: hypothetical protein [unclassified Sphingobium]CAD7336114.1 hypothetical protein SPHS6_00848 [Sphingobium sp. S6]CAD7336179.1 hypothetical protein SPHS8_00889 [Sphingobium sp. S8]